MQGPSIIAGSYCRSIHVFPYVTRFARQVHADSGAAEGVVCFPGRLSNSSSAMFWRMCREEPDDGLFDKLIFSVGVGYGWLNLLVT